MRILVSPSLLAYMYRECPRCTWLKFNKGVKRPGGDFSDFNVMDGVQKAALPKGASLRAVGIPGIVHSIGTKVVSRDFGNSHHSIQIFGYTDLLVALDEGGHAVVDLKSGRYDAEKVARYSQQTGAYALGLTEPEIHQPMDIRAAYLVFCSPTISTYVEGSQEATLMTQWSVRAAQASINADDARRDIAKLFEMVTSPEVPAVGPDCPYCRFANRLLEEARKIKEERAA